jgi:tetratricopeptide (TPR) repeat protein
VRETLERVATNYFHLYPQDVPFAMGLIYQYLGDYAKALSLYQQSLGLFGENVTTCCNIATCLLELGDEEQARPFAQRALELDPDDEDALDLADRLEIEDPAPAATDI